MNFTIKYRIGIINGSVIQARNTDIRLSSESKSKESSIRINIANETASRSTATKLAKK